MPNGKTHDLITVVTATAAAPFMLILPQVTAEQVAVVAVSYLVSGLLFSPDLDLHSGPYMRWKGLRFIWLPYQKMFHHRSPFSHNMLLGPTIRIVYFGAVLFLLLLAGLLLLNLLIPVDPTGTVWSLIHRLGDYIQRYPGVAALALLGFFLGAAAHTLADYIWSYMKRRF